MRFPKPSLLFRDDTVLGVCEALGQDFGFNPFFLRAALAASLLWNPVVIVSGYVAAAIVIGLVRIAFPDPRTADVARTAPAPVAETVEAHRELEPQPLAA
ncbi:MAG TPA: PspC domain-containing protein [Allosphingosinicella sp.]|jgi:phage shock protein PspC (stress-responsive transcriptional regulator)